ncbi:MAG TPA: glycosyltransferase family 2 protein [Burkholderiales bacterium]|nr:glycosyltransferase family 2 protein [Burkholderiales bacterium]
MTQLSNASSFFEAPKQAPNEANASQASSDVALLLPPGEDARVIPEVSIVIPAMNEEITIGEFVAWCKEGLAKAGVQGEILIVDSSTDRTAEIALAGGARVLKTPRRGVGRAYIDAIPHARGNLIIMGDCDLTYDFRELQDFIDRYREGYEFVIGSRFKGSIERGAMPALHQYFGTPFTTWILNTIYRDRFTDIHTGMRGVTKEALKKINIQSESWEYASEMVLKASRLGLRIAEVPIKFYKDREGRVSHHKRVGFWSPWYAGWINLKAMLVYTPDSFLLAPGLFFFALGALLTISLGFGSYSIGPIGFDLHWMLLGTTLAVLGYGCVQIGVLARLDHGLRSGFERTVAQRLSYDSGMAIAAVLIGIGLILTGRFLWQYIAGGFRLSEVSHPAVLGLFLIIIGFQTFGFTLLIEMMRRIKR